MPHANQSPTEKHALRIPEFCRAFGVGRSKFYELAARRELHPRKSGKQTLIPVAEAERWFNGLPAYEPKMPPRAATRAQRRGRKRG